MIPLNLFKNTARSRFEESNILLNKHRYDGAVYLCGYSIEIGFKVKICENFNLPAFPETDAEFKTIKPQIGFDFRTHDLEKLLLKSGFENSVKLNYMAEWSVIALWNPEVRYRPLGSINKLAAENMINSAKTIRALL